MKKAQGHCLTDGSDATDALGAMTAILRPPRTFHKADSLADLGCDGLPCTRILLIFEVGAKVFEGYLVQLKCSLIIPSIILGNSFLHVLCAWMPRSGDGGPLQALLIEEDHARSFRQGFGMQQCRLLKSSRIYMVRHCMHPICAG